MATTERIAPSAGRLLARGAEELAQAGIAESRWEAERLLRHALGWSREKLLARLGEPVAPEATGVFFELIDRRRGRVPLQYLVGIQEFWGLELRVTPRVFIPRPETELLVEEALRVLSGRALVADVGCGSGCIAVALAHASPEARVYATDRSPEAVALTIENARRHGVADRIVARTGDLLEPVVAAGLGGRLDAVVSNPPYIAEGDVPTLPPEVREHEPRLALAAGPEGLSVLDRLAPQAAEVLRPGGWLLVEVGAGMAEAVRQRFAAHGLEPARVASDLAGIERVVGARKRVG